MLRCRVASYLAEKDSVGEESDHSRDVRMRLKSKLVKRECRSCTSFSESLDSHSPPLQ